MADVPGPPPKGLVRWLILGAVLVVFGLTFTRLYVTYVATRFLAPDLLGDVADRPATYAALIALVALPLDLALLAVFSWKRIRATIAGVDPPPEPARTGPRRLGTRLVLILPDVAAALIVIRTFADPAPWSLPVVTILGPVVLSWSFTALGALRRRGWRRWTRRDHQPQHAMPDGPARP